MFGRLLGVVLIVGSPFAWAGCGGATGGTESPDAGAHRWDRCGGPGECVALVPGCCGVCGAPTLDDVVGVNADERDAFRDATCSDPNPTCPKCAEMAEPNLIAVCTNERCAALDLRADAFSACKTDADCMLRGPDCCESCGPQPFELVAIAESEASRYHAAVCRADQACPACAPIYPPELGAVCADDGHCKVERRTNVCPAEQPQEGAACGADATLSCEYGNDVRTNCRTHATCSGGAWQVAISGCPPLPGPGEAGCPVVSPGAADCLSDGLICDMGADELCVCSACAGGPCSITPRWSCAGPPSTPGCPPRAPLLGSACTDADLVCLYGPGCVSVSAGRRCASGAWVNEPLVCPL